MKQGNTGQGAGRKGAAAQGGRSGKPSRRGAAEPAKGAEASRKHGGSGGQQRGRGNAHGGADKRARGKRDEARDGVARGAKHADRDARREATGKAKRAGAQGGKPKHAGKHGHGAERHGKQQAVMPDRSAFLPVNRADMLARGWDQCDFVFVCGDAYVDHPSFGMAIITRLLEANHYKVGVICQPDWRDPESIAVLGEPRLGFLVSAGNMDSMVNHYTVAKKHRGADAFSPGGKMGLRPDRAAVVYGNLIRRTFKDTPIIIGGIEASLRRLAHYDYWSDKLKRSILLDSGADLVSYGMGEHSIVEIADALAAGLSVSDITFIDGTVYRAKSLEHVGSEGEGESAYGPVV